MRETQASALERMLTEAGAKFEDVDNMEKEKVREEEDMIVNYARKELELAGLFDKDSDYNGMLGESVMELMTVFSKQEHSGISAGITTSIIEKLMRFQPLTPLTDNPKEWGRTGDEQMWQSTRRPDAFSANQGKTYYLLDEAENGKKIFHKTELCKSKK